MQKCIQNSIIYFNYQGNKFVITFSLFLSKVGKHMASKQGILDLDVVDYEMVFDTKVNLNLKKADRLIYGDSEMNHAMVLTGVHVEVKYSLNNIFADLIIY